MKQPRLLKVIGIDYVAIFVAVSGLIALGMVMVLSASSITSIQLSGNAYSIFLKQLLFITIGSTLAYLSIKIKWESWELLARFSFLIGLVTLLATLFLGKPINGNKNWIPIGPFLIQPSEFAKLALILFCALRLKRTNKSNQDVIPNSLVIVGPIAFIYLALILAEKDLGTALIFGGIAFSLMFIAGLNRLYASGTFITILFGSLIFAVTQPNRLRRFKAVLNPFAPEVYKFAGWQPAHSIMGLASGGLFGVGVGASKQKWANLAEAHTDFIFSVIGEEMGLLGTLIVLALYSILLVAIFRTAMRCKDLFQKFAVAGIGFWLVMQIFTNIATNVGIAPVIGVTLPFISYGGSAIVANLIAIGFVFKVALEQAGVTKFSKAEKRIAS
jgi:cell division protein FtsW